jgi:hypothetical protein
MSEWDVYNKNSYNEGNRIATSSDPTWSLEDNVGHTPISLAHAPCGYWPKGIVAPINPRSYSYITALSSNPPQLVSRINYYTSAIDPTSGSIVGCASVPGLFPTVYNGKLYMWGLKTNNDWFQVYEFDLETKIHTRTLQVASVAFGVGPGYRVGNMLYVCCASDNYGGANYRMRIHEVDLDTFTTTGRMVGVPFSYGTLLNLTIAGSLMFLISWTHVIVFDFASFTYITNTQYSSGSDGYQAGINNERTECIVARNNNTPCLMKLSLANPPVILGTQNTTWLPTSDSMGLAVDANNNVYISDKFNLKLYKFNLTAFDTPVLYDYLSTGTIFTGLVCAGEDLWCANNYTWIDAYRKIVRIKTATMAVDHIIDLPAWGDIIYSVIVY